MQITFPMRIIKNMSNLLATLDELISDVESAKYKLEWVLRELDQLKIQFEDTDIDPPDEYRKAKTTTEWALPGASWLPPT